MQQLVQQEMELLAPLVKSKKYGRAVPIFLVYENVMKAIDPDKAKDDEDRQRRIKHKEQIIKTSVLIDAPEEFWNIQYCEETGKDYVQFMQQPLEIRAKYIARRSLANMLEIVDRHLELMEQKKRDALKKPTSTKR